MASESLRRGWRRGGEAASGFALGLASLTLMAHLQPAERGPSSTAAASAAPGRHRGEAGSEPGPEPPLPDGAAWPAAVASYRMEARLDPTAHEVDGTAVVRWKNTSATEQSELYLHLYLNAFRSGRTVFMRSDQGEGFRGAGTPAAWGRVDVSRFYVREHAQDLWPDADPHTPDDPEDKTDIRVPLPQPVAPGGSLTIEMAWQAKLPSLVLRTGHVRRFHMVAQWFPKLARLEPDGRWAHFPFHRLSEFYADFGDYDVTVDLPDGFAVGATGALASEERTAGRVRRRYVQPGVHDFAFAAWDQFRELTRRGPEDVELRCLYPPGRDEAAELELEVAAAGLAYLNEAYGRYPYPVLTLVHPPDFAAEAGGMEYPTLIMTGGEWYWPWLGVRTVEQFVVHELAHQWFYGILATDEHRWPFLDEGLTSYAEIEVMESLYPGSSAFGLLGLRGGMPGATRAWAAEGWDNDVIAKGADAFASGSDYGALVYAKAATLLGTLARVYGKARLRAVLGRYASEHRFAHPTPDDLLAAVGHELGADAAEQLRVGLFERSWVDYAVAEVGSSRLSPTARRERSRAADALAGYGAPAGQGSAGGWQSFAVVRRRGNLAFPVDVELTTVEGRRHRLSWDGREHHARLELRTRAPLGAAVIDPDHRVLLDRDLSNNARSSTSSAWTRLWAPRVWVHGAHAAQLGLSLVAP